MRDWNRLGIARERVEQSLGEEDWRTADLSDVVAAALGMDEGETPGQLPLAPPAGLRLVGP